MCQIAYLQLTEHSAKLVSECPAEVTVDLAARTYTVTGRDRCNNQVEVTYPLGEAVKWCTDYHNACLGELFHPAHARYQRIGLVIVVGELAHLQTAVLHAVCHARDANRGYVYDD